MTDANFGSSFGPTSVGGAPLQGADVPPAAAPAPQSASPAAGGMFGSGVGLGTFGGANYTPPDPQTSALDQTADTLQQRIKRANDIATNPIAAFLSPEDVQKARDFIPQATETLQKIKTQKAAMAAGRTEAETLGLAPGEVADEATQADRVAVAQSKALKGDLKAFQGLAAVKPEAAAAIQDQVHEAVRGHMNNAQLAFDSLAGMQNAGQYDAKLKQLRTDGTITDLEALGMKVPKSFDEFNAVKGREGQALRQARQASENLGASLEARANGEVMEKKEAEGYKGRLTTSYGDELNNGTWSRVNGKRAFAVNGQGDVNDLGKKFTYASPEQRKAILEDIEKTIPKAEMEKTRSNMRLYGMATTDSKGNQIPSEGLQQGSRKIYINDNPNVQQGIAEGLASMLRGGMGGATAGLLNIETSKRGAVQTMLDKLQGAYAGGVNTLKGEQVKPYLTQLTEKQQRDVLDYLKAYEGKAVSDRLAPIAKRAGALGLDASSLGLDKKEFGGIEDQLEAGRQDTIARFGARSRPTSGGDGAIYLDTPPSLLVHKPDVPGTVHPPVPPPVTAQPTPTPAALPGGPPVTIAGQPVSVALPQGASPNFLPALQRIESGNEKDPWTAGNDKSSAKGAFQFIDDTWKQNRPVGAPDDPRKATPDQQAAALATLTTKNAATLTNLKLPVNDTTLYMAHNVGAGGASALLSASPTADARSVIGEVAAKNNPMFFKGKPTVATVLQRYQDAMAGDDAGPKPRPGAGGATAEAPGFLTRLSRALQQGIPADQRDQAAADVGNAAVEHAPVIGGAVGGITGGPVGGGVGGGAGQAFKDYMQGRPFDPVETAKQTALGGVLSVGSAARPVLAAGARTLGAGGVEAGAEAAKGGDAGDIADAGAKGVAESAGGELFGRALGMGAHKIWSWLTPEAKTVVQGAAKDLHEANQVLAKEEPKLPGANGVSTPNPAYDAAQAAKDKAETTIKDVLPTAKPDEVAYAHKISAENEANPTAATGKEEAQVARPVTLEKERLGAGYQQLENEVGDKGVGAVKETAKPLQDGPITAVVSGKVPKAFGEIASQTEKAITAPAANWQEKWTQLKDARSALLDKEREAYSSTSDRKGETAEAYRALADTVRAQQEKTAKYVFGEQDGKAFMGRLKVLDGRYRTLMEATNGGDIGAAARLTGDAGRKADKAFRSFAMGDKPAIAAWDAMRGVKSNVEKDVRTLVGAESIPVLGRVISAAKLMTGFRDYIRERAAGSPATFTDLVPELKAARKASVRTAADVGGQIGGHVTTQSDVFGSAFQ